MPFVIRNEMNATYYTGNNPRFPAFGATKKRAFRYATKEAALADFRVMPLMVLADIEEVAK